MLHGNAMNSFKKSQPQQVYYYYWHYINIEQILKIMFLTWAGLVTQSITTILLESIINQQGKNSPSQ